MSPSERPPMPKMPKPDEETKTFFRSVVPDAPDVTVRPMFGNLAAFVNGNMFAGLFGEDVFVRLSDGDRDALMDAGGGPFEPMPGRPMTGYTMLPAAWRGDEDLVEAWVLRSLTWARTMPSKEAKKKR